MKNLLTLLIITSLLCFSVSAGSLHSLDKKIMNSAATLAGNELAKDPQSDFGYYLLKYVESFLPDHRRMLASKKSLMEGKKVQSVKTNITKIKFFKSLYSRAMLLNKRESFKKKEFNKNYLSASFLILLKFSDNEIVHKNIAEKAAFAKEENLEDLLGIFSMNKESTIEAQSPLMQSRFGKGKEQAYRTHGIPSSVDKASEKALRWLLKGQSPSGAIGPNAGTTALAICAILAHGDVANGEDFSKQQKLAEKGLINSINKKKSYILGTGGVGDCWVLIALSELYLINPDPTYKKAIIKCLDIIDKGQHKDGSFMFNFREHEGMQSAFFTSIVMYSLHAVLQTKISENKVKGYIKKAAKFVSSMKKKDSFRDRKKQKDVDKKISSIMRTLCASSLWVNGYKSGIKPMIDQMHTKDLAKYSYDKEDVKLLNCFVALNTARIEKQYWNKSSKRVYNELLKNQQASGKWDVKVLEKVKRIERMRSSDVYATAMSILILNTHLRNFL